MKPKKHKPASLEICLWVTFRKLPAEGRLAAKTNSHGSYLLPDCASRRLYSLNRIQSNVI